MLIANWFVTWTLIRTSSMCWSAVGMIVKWGSGTQGTPQIPWWCCKITHTGKHFSPCLLICNSIFDVLFHLSTVKTLFASSTKRRDPNRKNYTDCHTDLVGFLNYILTSEVWVWLFLEGVGDLALGEGMGRGTVRVKCLARLACSPSQHYTCNIHRRISKLKNTLNLDMMSFSMH